MCRCAAQFHSVSAKCRRLRKAFRPKWAKKHAANLRSIFTRKHLAETLRNMLSEPLTRLRQWMLRLRILDFGHRTGALFFDARFWADFLMHDLCTSSHVLHSRRLYHFLFIYWGGHLGGCLSRWRSTSQISLCVFHDPRVVFPYAKLLARAPPCYKCVTTDAFKYYI